MIKKLLGYTIVVILIICGYFCAFKGLQIGEFKILSYNQLIEEKENYEQKVTEYNYLVDEKYKAALNRLESAKTTFESNKSTYEELKQYNSYDDLLQLAKDKQYPLEFLWIKLDLIARNNNLASNFVLANSATKESKNINVTLAGEYLAVKHYIYDMLIDLDLHFKAENIEITPSGNGVIATFVIKDVKVVM